MPVEHNPYILLFVARTYSPNKHYKTNFKKTKKLSDHENICFFLWVNFSVRSQPMFNLVMVCWGFLTRHHIYRFMLGHHLCRQGECNMVPHRWILTRFWSIMWILPEAWTLVIPIYGFPPMPNLMMYLWDLSNTPIKENVNPIIPLSTFLGNKTGAIIDRSEVGNVLIIVNVLQF